MSEWQDIKTAPKDGSIVLGCALHEDGGLYLSLVMWVKEDENVLGRSGEWVGPSCWATQECDAVPAMLTHWASLPSFKGMDHGRD